MQAIDLATLKAAKATDRRALAILAYDNATADPAGANWRGVADLLRLVLPTAKVKAAEILASDPLRPSWADYDIPQNATRKLGKSPIIVVTLADGETVRAPAVSLPGKPVNIGRGLRVAFAYYRARMAARHAGEMSAWSDCVNVPAFVSIVCESTGAEYDAADCSVRTATARAGEFDPATVAAEATARGLPSASDDGSLTAGEYVRAKYFAACARLRLAAGVSGDDPAGLTASIEDAELRAAGECWLEIRAKRKAAHGRATAGDRAAELKATLQAKWAARRPFAVVVSNDPAPAAPAEIGSAAKTPAAPSFAPARRYLASTALTLVRSSLPVAPSCAIRVA